MAYDKDTFRRFHSYGLTADAAILLATFLHDLDADIGVLEGEGLSQATAVADLAGGATLPQTVTKVNDLLAALRTAGLLDT